MSNKEAHIKLLKYSIDKIKTIEDYDKKMSYLDEFKRNRVLDKTLSSRTLL